jgi:hypothetical protein
MKIGFFGDSFCEEMNNPHNLYHGYDTYLTTIKKHYNAEIVHLGHGGSSYWDSILKQFPRVDIPDVCIFTWTDYHRIYHPVVRNLTYGSVVDLKIKDFRLSNIFNYNTVEAAKRYFKFLHDDTKSKEEMISALYRFDREVLAKLTNTHVIHAWCFDNIYEWQNGSVLPIILNDLAEGSSSFAPNHLGSDKQNFQLANMLIEIIDAKIQSNY